MELGGSLHLGTGEEIDLNTKTPKDGHIVIWAGDFSDPDASEMPAGLTNVIAIAGGFAHVLALKNDGTVVAWGSNPSGETGLPEGLRDVIAIAAGDGHSMAPRKDGSIVAWGSNLFGKQALKAV
jgi:alpha-tubulin suppressor-like RCC1 family protein